MTGEWTLNQLNRRAGSASEYTDVVFGKVVKAKPDPLEIQYANDLILTEEFLTLSKHVTNYEEVIEIDCDGEKKKQTIKHLNELKKNDHVAMIREDGGNEFFVLEKVEEETPKPKKEALEWFKNKFKQN